MNSVERVMATVGGKPVDRPAVGVVLSLYGAKLTGCPLERYYSNAEEYVKGQIAVRETFEPDMLFSPFYYSGIGEAFGGKITFLPSYSPNLKRPAVNSAEAMLTLENPDVDNHPRLLFMRESTKQLASKYGGEVPIIAVMPGPVDLPPLVMGFEAWMETLLFNNDLAKEITQMSTDFFKNWANTLITDGANVIVITTIFNADMVTSEMVKDIAVPSYNESFKDIKGPIILHHTGARILPFLEHYTSLPNVIGYAVGPQDSLYESRMKIGPDKVLLGNISGPTLNKKTPAEIRAKCDEILDDRMNDPHFILATSGADVTMDTPKENIQTIIQAAKDHTKGI